MPFSSLAYLRSLVWVAALVTSPVVMVAGCDGARRTPAGGSGGGGEPTGTGGSGAGGQTTETGGAGGGGAGGMAMREPLHHRPAPVACNTAPRPESPLCRPDPLFAATSNCAMDGDCTAGVGGRCRGAFDLPCLCTYDSCSSDGDCTLGGPCSCTAGARSTRPNVCRPGNCQIDADCGPAGYCSPTRGRTAIWQDQSELDAGGYACHTPADACVNDVDCPQMNRGSYCGYDDTTARWVCMNYWVR